MKLKNSDCYVTQKLKLCEIHKIKLCYTEKIKFL